MKAKPRGGSAKGVRQGVRAKTTIRMSPKLAKTVDKLLVEAGISKNAFFVMAIMHQAISLARVSGSESTLTYLEQEYQRVLGEARSAMGG